MDRKKAWIAGLVVTAALVVIVYTQITLLVVPPNGRIPDGIIAVTLRPSAMNFVDSPDGVCQRRIAAEMSEMENKLCPFSVVLAVTNYDHILFRVPYSEWLYLISTGGIPPKLPEFR